MGNGNSADIMEPQCDNPLPTPENLCYVSVGGYSPEMPRFCSMLGIGGDGYREQYCGYMGTGSGEWGNQITAKNNCKYASGNQPQDLVTGGCCGDASCGIAGGGLQCQRIKFTGDPVTCCFNDLVCDFNNPAANPTPANCYSDPNKTYACSDGVGNSKNYRSIVSNDCQEVLYRYCTGTMDTDDPNSIEWINRWMLNGGGTGSCAYALIRNLYNFPEGGGTGRCPPPGAIDIHQPGVCNQPPLYEINADGYFWGQQLINTVFEKYQDQGFTIGTIPGNDGYNPFQEFLYNSVCCPYPGLCQSALTTACATTTSQRLSLNQPLAQWCGCHLPQGEYQEYSVKFNIPPQCTPMCNRIGAVPIVGINADPVTCEQQICMIDNVSLNLVRAESGGGVNFNQVCGNCEGGYCSCIISDTSIDIINSTIGGDIIPVDQHCGTLTCTQTNPGSTGPATITVPCGATAGYNPYDAYDQAVAASKQASRKSSYIWTLVIILVALLVIYLIIVVVVPGVVALVEAREEGYVSITDKDTLPVFETRSILDTGPSTAVPNASNAPSEAAVNDFVSILDT